MRRIECPNCGRRLKYGDEHSGKKARCQKCATFFLLPPPTVQQAEVGPPTLELKATTEHQGSQDGLPQGMTEDELLKKIESIKQDLILAMIEGCASRPDLLKLDPGTRLARAMNAAGELCEQIDHTPLLERLEKARSCRRAVKTFLAGGLEMTATNREVAEWYQAGCAAVGICGAFIIAIILLASIVGVLTSK